MKEWKNYNLNLVLKPPMWNIVIAQPRMLIALLENNYLKDGCIKIPKVLQPYMVGKEILEPKK